MSDAFPSHAGTRPLTEAEKLVIAIASGVSIGYALSLIAIFFQHIWILDAHGRAVEEDFLSFWTAGGAALKGMALAAYDAHRQHATQVTLMGHEFSGTLEWSYPPLFLFVAVCLACLPYASAFALWSTATMAIHAGVAAAIAGQRRAFLLACAAPWTFAAMLPGQNGFLTAALLGLSLLHVERRPAMAGLLIGLLSYKPQLGVLIPLALAAGGYWRSFAWACAGCIGWNALAGVVFGFGTFDAFVHAVRDTSHSHLIAGALSWCKLQSAYGFARALGAGAVGAWGAQLVVSGAAAAAIVACWRSDTPYALKAALLAALAPQATPYVLVYDLPVLSVAAAFLYRDRSFDRTDWCLLGAAAPLTFAFLFVPVPSAFLASVAVAAMVLRRIYSRTRISPSCATEATSVPSSA